MAFPDDTMPSPMAATIRINNEGAYQAEVSGLVLAASDSTRLGSTPEPASSNSSAEKTSSPTGGAGEPSQQWVTTIGADGGWVSVPAGETVRSSMNGESRETTLSPLPPGGRARLEAGPVDVPPPDLVGSPEAHPRQDMKNLTASADEKQPWIEGIRLLAAIPPADRALALEFFHREAPAPVQALYAQFEQIEAALSKDGGWVGPKDKTLQFVLANIEKEIRHRDLNQHASFEPGA